MIQFDHLSGLQAMLLFAALAVPIILIGRRSLVALGPVRQWVAIGARLLVVLLIVLILAGIRVERTNRDVEVMVLRDVSRSTQLVPVTDGNLRKAVDDYLKAVVANDPAKRQGDRIGLISFDRDATVDAAPNPELILDARATRESSNGTDVAGAIQLALATMSREAMDRIVLIWDGRQTLGDLDEAISQAASKGIPIDVMPLQYEARNEVIVESMNAPPTRRENEPFTIDVVLRSTNPGPVTGNLRVRHQSQDMDLDATQPGVQAVRAITLPPGQRHVERIQVPALSGGGVHQFETIFEAPNVTTEVAGRSRSGTVGDTIRDNNTASSFTFVRGQGQVLYVDNVGGELGQFLQRALQGQGINIDANRTSVDQFPTSLVELQNYDAVILANVRRGAGGLSDQQQEMLASYVRDTGGGLVMIGGFDTFGAGGWQGSKLEEVLPVNMDIPATRMIPKGALAVIVHSCEFPSGNYWGMQCAIKAAEVLSPRDDIGILSYQWANNGGTGWDYPLSPRGDGARVIAAIKNMQIGDMPDFDDAMEVALNGSPGQPGLAQSDARQKHVIIISDGDPSAPSPSLVKAYQDAQVSVSTISVFPHELPLPKTMVDIAQQTQGRSYGPIESNPSQLPQIFVKEATVVRRSLISEDKDGIEVKDAGVGGGLDLLRGIAVDRLPKVFGIVLTSRKESPQVEVPLVVGPNNDPLLAYWQVGLGKVAAFTSDAHNRWAANWVGMDAYDKFWSQIVRGVSKPAESADFDARVAVTGDQGKITVEAVDPNADFRNFLNIRGSVVGPDMKPMDVRLRQVRPGVYEGEFPAAEAGNYVAGLAYQSSDGKSGVLRSGTVVNSSPELRDLTSDFVTLKRVADATRGRLLDPFNATATSLFTRDGLSPSRSPLPIWDWLLPLLIVLLLTDIAIRRIAWDWQATRQLAHRSIDFVRMFTTTRTVETTGSLDALREVRSGKTTSTTTVDRPATAKPDPTYKFEAREQVSGKLSDVVGGATDKPMPKSTGEAGRPKGQQGDKPGTGGGMSGLLDAKRKAQEEIRRREEGEK